MVKVIANYLPQYHSIPENDKWWGKGYSDWVAAKNAKPLYDGHCQPKIPLNDNYYDLSNIESIRWQAELAKSYGVYGFGMYHYWFTSKLQLLQKPAELLLSEKSIDIHYMFIWDNDSWKRSWSNVRGNEWVTQKGCPVVGESKYLAELVYGDKSEWKKHFEYLLPFFMDERYIRCENKPLFGFMQPDNNTEVIKEMVEYWNVLARENGFKDGLMCISREKRNVSGLDYTFRYIWDDRWIKLLGIGKILQVLRGEKFKRLNYDNLWHKILVAAKACGKNTFLSGFVQYDETPRRKEGVIIEGSTPEKFQKYYTELLTIAKLQGKEYVFCPAWNEWGEGMYLEPDKMNGYGYLNALKAAVDCVNEDQ